LSLTTYRQGTANRQGLLDLCAALPVCGTAIEVGSYAGESAEIFLQSGKVAHITCVDPFFDEDVEREFDRRMAAFPGRVTKIKALSMAALEGLLRCAQYDFIYIDARHDYPSASWDIRHWQMLLRPGGYIGGHDYTEKQPGVVRAVNEEFGQPWRVFQDGSWLCRIGS
jgi:predicted O-methyltransferase YrrM